MRPGAITGGPVSLLVALVMALSTPLDGIAQSSPRSAHVLPGNADVVDHLNHQWPSARLLLIGGCDLGGGRTVFAVLPVRAAEGEVLVLRGGKIRQRGVVRYQDGEPSMEMTWKARGEATFDPWASKLLEVDYVLTRADNVSASLLAARASEACK